MIRQEKAKKVLQELADSHLWKSTLQSFEVKVPVAACGLLSPVLLGKIYVLGYLADFLSEWQFKIFSILLQKSQHLRAAK